MIFNVPLLLLHLLVLRRWSVKEQIRRDFSPDNSFPYLAVIDFKVANYERPGLERNWGDDDCLEILKGNKK